MLLRRIFFPLMKGLRSDGTLATAEKEFTALVEAAHARGLYVIVDIVINHSARVFDYILNGISADRFHRRKYHERSTWE